MIVTLSDGTIAGYVAEELLELRPHRELTRWPRGIQQWRSYMLELTVLGSIGEVNVGKVWCDKLRQ